MLIPAIALLSTAELAGIALCCFYLLERPIRGWSRLGSIAHGLAGAAGAALAALVVLRGAPDPQNFGHLTIYALAATLALALVIIAAQLRRRRPPGLAVAIHATIGMGALVILLAYLSIPA